MAQDSTQSIKLEQKYCPKCYGQYEGAATTCAADGTELRGPHNDPLIGKTFAERYDIESVLGLGGMSIVYKARHKLMDRIVAIKMLHGNIKGDHLSLERFRMEAQAASSLNHQNIITVYDFGVTPQSEAFFVMDYLDGESLSECLERKSRLPWERAVNVFKQICDGLGAAHKKGIVHRDMKPANVILIKPDEGQEQVKLVDFGIAKLLPSSGKAQQSLTKTGEVFGSPIYMSPEQCLGKEVDRHSDIYALGCLMYETLSGVPPHLGPTFLDTLNKHVGEQARPIREVAPDIEVPMELERIIEKCLQKKPEDRFDTTEEIRDHLSALTVKMGDLGIRKLASISGPVTTVSDTPTMAQVAAECKPPNPVWKYIAAVAVVALFGGVGFAALWPGPPEDGGTPLNKLFWTMAVARGTDATGKNDLNTAESALNEAQRLTEGFHDGNVRLEATLRRKCDLYSKWEGHADRLEKTNIEIGNLQDKRLRDEVGRLMVTLDSLKIDPNSDASSVENINTQLRAQADVPFVLSTSSRLYGRRMYHEQSQLLLKALAIEKKLLGDNAPAVGQIETNLADGLIGLRRYPEVRPYLMNALDIRKSRMQSEPAEYVRALSKLGQFDLDQSNMELAEKELWQALELAKKYQVERELRVLCLRSYADLLRQTKREADSQRYQKEAEALEAQIHGAP